MDSYLYSLVIKQNKFVFGDIANKTWSNVFGLYYAPQANIPIAYDGTKLSVATGAPDAVQEFKWYKDGILAATTQSSKYTPSGLGSYSCTITHNTLTVPNDYYQNLILQSDNFSLCTSQTTITGVKDVCDGQIFVYNVPLVTGATNYQWTITNGVILSGQGTNRVRVRWSGILEGKITVSALQ